MKQDIMHILADWNLWWGTGEVPEILLGREGGKSKELIDLGELRETRKTSSNQFNLLGKMLPLQY